MSELNWGLTRKKATLEKRAAILEDIRAFFSAHGYIEVETPHCIPANAPEVHIDQVAGNDWALHTSPEIAMKRMLAAGYEKIFQICRVWRDKERGQLHLPEFTILEWYRTGIDYKCEELLLALAPQGFIQRSEKKIDLASPWERLTVAEAFARYASKSLKEAIQEDLFEEILTGEVEPRLGQNKPTFLTEYPITMAALARTKPNDPEVAERFELYIDGVELANAFSELTDPVEQRCRFEEEERARRNAGKKASPLPERFLNEMENMPEAAGIALGVDRLIMLLTLAKGISEVSAFTPEEL
jgi:lysyl-tRNA synthetase class 2